MLDNKTKRSFQKSVRYPYYNLSECVSFAEIIHRIGGRREAPVSSILKELNVTNESNKRYRYLISSSEQFGLIEKTENGLKATDIVKNILYPTEGEEQKYKFLKECFAKPNFYKIIIEQYKESFLPNVDTLTNVFLHLGIAPNVVDQAVASFISSAKYADVLKDDRLSFEDDSNETEAISEKSGVADPSLSGLREEKKQLQPELKVEEYHKFEFLTSSGKKALVQIPIDCTNKDLIKLKSLLDVLCGE